MYQVVPKAQHNTLPPVIVKTLSVLVLQKVFIKLQCQLHRKYKSYYTYEATTRMLRLLSLHTNLVYLFWSNTWIREATIRAWMCNHSTSTFKTMHVWSYSRRVFVWLLICRALEVVLQPSAFSKEVGLSAQLPLCRQLGRVLITFIRNMLCTLFS